MIVPISGLEELPYRTPPVHLPEWIHLEVVGRHSQAGQLVTRRVLVADAT
jgi:hypothetical protein